MGLKERRLVLKLFLGFRFALLDLFFRANFTDNKFEAENKNLVSDKTNGKRVILVIQRIEGILLLS